MTSGIITAVLLVLFVGGWIWAWSPRRKPEFDAAAQLPLDEQDADANKENRS
ncbi:MAG TPA: cbb3-type cytochrome c oxidase subunit 3 [Lysobacter sp.]